MISGHIANQTKRNPWNSPAEGIEPSTIGLKSQRSTFWAKQAQYEMEMENPSFDLGASTLLTLRSSDWASPPILWVRVFIEIV